MRACACSSVCACMRACACLCVDPATLEPLASVADMTADDVNFAIYAAADALPAWKAKLAKVCVPWGYLSLDPFKEIVCFL